MRATLRRMRAAFKWGPCAAVRWGRKARRGIDRDVDSFSSGQESCRKARPHLTDLPGMDARQAPNGVAFSLVTFSWPRKRKLLALRRRTKALRYVEARKISGNLNQLDAGFKYVSNNSSIRRYSSCQSSAWTNPCRSSGYSEIQKFFLCSSMKR